MSISSVLRGSTLKVSLSLILVMFLFSVSIMPSLLLASVRPRSGNFSGSSPVDVKFSGIPGSPVSAGMAGNGTVSDDATAGKVCTPFNALDIAIAFGEFSGEVMHCAAT